MTTTTIEDVRRRYRSRVESKLQPYQLAAMLTAARGFDPAKGTPAINGVAIDAATLTRIGNALAGLAVKECNEALTERDHKRRGRLIEEAETIAASYGMTVTACGDPRGYVFGLHAPGIFRNGWGEGFGVA